MECDEKSKIITYYVLYRTIQLICTPEYSEYYSIVKTYVKLDSSGRKIYLAVFGVNLSHQIIIFVSNGKSKIVLT